MDVEGHIDEPAMVNAMEELQFYCMKDEVRLLMPPAGSPSTELKTWLPPAQFCKKADKMLVVQAGFVSYKTEEVWVDIYPANPVRSEEEAAAVGCLWVTQSSTLFCLLV